MKSLLNELPLITTLFYCDETNNGKLRCRVSFDALAFGRIWLTLLDARVLLSSTKFLQLMRSHFKAIYRTAFEYDLQFV